jgi:hypothetical protein
MSRPGEKEFNELMVKLKKTKISGFIVIGLSVVTLLVLIFLLIKIKK